MVLLSVPLFSAAKGPRDRVGVGGDTRHAASSGQCSADSAGLGGTPQGELRALWGGFYAGQRSEALASGDQRQPDHGLFQHSDCAALSCCASGHTEGRARLEDQSQCFHGRLQVNLQAGWTFSVRVFLLNDEWHFFCDMCFYLSHFQAAVEVPQYLGVNLLVEGAPVKRSHYRQSFTSNSPLTHRVHPDQSSAPEVEARHKQSSQKLHVVADFHLLGKENQEKKRQVTSTCPKRERDVKSELQSTCHVRRSSGNAAHEQTTGAHTEPQRKAWRLGLRRRISPATLVPRSLSFSVDPPYSTSEGKHQSIPRHASQMSRSFLSQRSSEPQQRISPRVIPSFQGLLPNLEAFRLQPNLVTGTNVCHSSAFLSHPRIHIHQLCLNSQRQVRARHKGELVGGQKYWKC